MNAWYPNAARMLLLMAPAMLGGCGPYVEPYRYISLADTPGLQQVEARQPELSGLYFAGDMPVRYELRRPGYAVEIMVPEGSYLPAIELSIDSADLRLVPADAEVPPAPIFCGAWYPDPADPARLQFGWSPNCDSEPPWGLTFFVTDDSGEQLGEEKLRFQLERNGWLVLVDAV